jgi:hypothetical protein
LTKASDSPSTTRSLQQLFTETLYSKVIRLWGTAAMKVSIGIGSAYYNGEDWDELVAYTMAADKMGVAQAWSAEAWGMDAIVPLAYLAAKTENIQLGTGILQMRFCVSPCPAKSSPTRGNTTCCRARAGKANQSACPSRRVRICQFIWPP